MLTILIKTEHGWTDNLGQADITANNWANHGHAEQAIEELQALWPEAQFKVVSTDELEFYDLVG